MTQAIGFVSLVMLMAFSLILLALGSVVIRKLRAGDLIAARGPLTIFAFLAFTIPASFFTWANSLASFSFASINTLLDSVGQEINADPASWICLGPLAIALVAMLVSPGPRKWVAENYFSLSVVTLVVAVIGAGLASLILLGGSWSVLAIIILLGVAVALGNEGLVFVPHLKDGPRVGESLTAAIPRIAVMRVRRGLYQAVDSIGSAPQNLLTKDAAIGALIVVAIAAVGLAYKYQPVLISSGSAPAAAPVAAAGVPTVAAPTVPAATATPTPSLVAYKVANTNKDGILLREQPSRAGKPIVSVMEGATVEPVATEVAEAEGVTWRRIKDVDGKVGWTSSEFLEPVYSYGMVKVQNAGSDGVYVRAKPGKAGSSVGIVHDGDELRLIGADAPADGKTWRNVGNGKDISGWIASDYLAPIGQ